MNQFTLKSALKCAVLVFSSMAAAQTLAADTGKSASAATKQQSETTAPKTKQQLVQRLLELWPVDAIVGLSMLRTPIEESMRQSRSLLQARTTPEKRDAALKDIEGYVQEFGEKYGKVVLEKGKKILPTTVEPILMEKMTEEELRQMIAILESPAKKKFESLGPEMQKAFGEKLAATEGKEIKEKMEELQQKIGKRLKEAVN